MKAVIQRVNKSSVTVNAGNERKVVGSINGGLLVLLGVSVLDDEKDADYLVEKIINLRIFEDENKKMNLSLLSVNGEMLVVSQFTLLANVKKGRRPSFVDAADPEKANKLYEYFVEKVSNNNISVQTGKFQAMMDVSLINSGPVTIIIDSRD